MIALVNRRSAPSRTLALAAALTLAVSSPVLLAQEARAAVPSFPDNVVVFPDRDFVSLEGFSEHAGESALVEVTRPGSGVLGSARATVSGGDVAFEVNHPGGVCWGAGTAAQVTPDIRAGDVVSITFPDGSHAETTTSSATVTADMSLSGTTLTVTGSLGADVNPAQMEQRIINPDLVDLIGKRDIRALPGPLVPAPRGGYSSGMEFPTPTTFVATYDFGDNVQAAQTAAAADLGERAMAWQVEDSDGNRQGLTIAEFGEAGGPGMGGCPNGPGNQAAPAGSASVVRSSDKTSVQVKWTPVEPQPGAAAVTGYTVTAISGTPDGSGQQGIVGRRTGASATQTTITGLDPDASYAVEVRSQAGPQLSEPFSMTAAPPTDPGDTTLPTLTIEPAPVDGQVTTASSVTASSNGQLFYTTDGSPVISGDLPSDSARLYAGPIPITAPTTVKIAAFDQVGNHRTVEGDYAPPASPTPPDAPTDLAGTTTQNAASLTWTAGPATVTGYQVTVFDAAGAALATQPPVTTVPRQSVTGLSPGTGYQFTVKARNAGGFGPESAPLSLTTRPATDTISITTARWKAGDFRVVGAGSQVGATITLHRVTSTGGVGAAIAGATTSVVAAAPPAVGDWTIRLRNGAAPATNPGRVIARSSGGGVTAPFTVTNG